MDTYKARDVFHAMAEAAASIFGPSESHESTSSVNMVDFDPDGGGKTNSPAYVPFVARQIAELKGIPAEAVAQVTSTNFERLFARTTSQKVV